MHFNRAEGFFFFFVRKGEKIELLRKNFSLNNLKRSLLTGEEGEKRSFKIFAIAYCLYYHIKYF